MSIKLLVSIESRSTGRDEEVQSCALFVARPGLIIGRKGQEVELLQDELQNLIGRRVNLKIEELTRVQSFMLNWLLRKGRGTTAKTCRFSSNDEAGDSKKQWTPEPKESRSNWQVVSVVRKWHAVKNKFLARYR